MHSPDRRRRRRRRRIGRHRSSKAVADADLLHVCEDGACFVSLMSISDFYASGITYWDIALAMLAFLLKSRSESFSVLLIDRSSGQRS